MKSRKETFLKSLRYLCLTFVFVIGLISIVGSGAGKNDSGTGTDTGTVTKTAPSISALAYTPIKYYIATSGETTVSGSMTFSDADGDVSTLTINVFDSDETQVDTIEQDLGVSNTTSGTINFTFDISASDSAYSFKVYLTDSNDLESNILEGALTGEEAVAPLIGTLTYKPSEVVIDGGSVEVTGTINYLDDNADITTIRITVYDADDNVVSYGDNDYIDQTVSVTATTGTISFTFYVNSPTEDDYSGYTFDIIAIDSAGLESNSIGGNEIATGAQVNYPAIGNLEITNTADVPDEAALIGESGGTVSFIGTMNFLDIQGKVSNVIVEVFPSFDSTGIADGADMNQALIDYTDTDLYTPIRTYTKAAVDSNGSDVLGETTGSINFEFYASTLTEAFYPVRVHVVDSDGNPSNYVYESINIQSRHPEIDNLLFSCSTYKIPATSSSVTITVTGAFDFLDEDGNLTNADADLARLVVAVSGPGVAAVTAPTETWPALGQEIGSIDFSFSFDATAIGAYTFYVYARDDIMMESNILTSHTITVTKATE